MNTYNKNKKHWSQVQMMGCLHMRMLKNVSLHVIAVSITSVLHTHASESCYPSPHLSLHYYQGQIRTCIWSLDGTRQVGPCWPSTDCWRGYSGYRSQEIPQMKTRVYPVCSHVFQVARGHLRPQTLSSIEECAINPVLCCLLVTINNAENCNSTLLVE